METRSASPDRTNRVAVYDGREGLRIEARPLPSPGPGELVLELRTCGFCGTDLFKIVNKTVPEGTVLGHELAGVVHSLGDGVEQFSVGDRVVVPHHVACGECALCRRGSRTLCSVFKENLMEPGGFSDRILIRPRAVRNAARIIPEGVSDETATLLEPAACVLRGVNSAGISVAEGCAVVIGGGSMGLLHLLVLRAHLPDLSVVVVDPLEERRRLSLELGAVAACAPEAGESVVRRVTHGLGADAAFDTVGGSPVLAEAIKVLRPGGTLVLFAHAREGEPAGFELNPFFKNEMRIVGTYSGSLDEQHEVARMLFSGRLDPSKIITHRLPLERAPEAVDLARGRRALKIMIGR